MARRAVVYEVLIASPRDVKAEREVLCDVIADWNATNSKSLGVILQAVRWEADASPAVVSDGHGGQGIINRQILDSADIILGVFWSRLGTRTIGHPSGTAEEIERAKQNGKEVMLYFSSARIPIDHDTEELKRLQEYRSSLQAGALLWTFPNRSKLRTDVTRHLGDAVRAVTAKFTSSISSPKNGQEVPREVLVTGQSGLAMESEQLWIVVVTEQGEVYPQGKVSPKTSFRVPVLIGVLPSGPSKGQRFSIRLVSIAKNPGPRVLNCLNGDSATGCFLAQDLQDGSTFAQVEVFRGD